MSYRPVQPGIPKTLRSIVQYEEVSPTSLDHSVVYKLWALQTDTPLERSFDYLVLPDGCVDIVFDLSGSPKTRGALIMTPHTTSVHLQLGTSFHYGGVRLYPGAWQFSPIDIVGTMKTVPTLTGVDFSGIQSRLACAPTVSDLWTILEDCGHQLQRAKIIKRNPTIAMLLDTDITSASNMAAQTGYSIRHIQRVLRRSVGFTPHDFIKVIRFQRALYQNNPSVYADQSHYIREFKRITGMTPRIFYQTYGNVA
ncbi:helix-turn-helix domain-containing protein [Streptomyces caniscabiei]|uniref:helix-turn-helix domain-containing protein n=1 Tax=Streptomyces caniscabiei TaxID=2746961 RepID=UPI0029B25854|nr:helix-turn-helix domain-containing protein [Streptomyces caniscabiei]MDX2776593.1 helix-turn-helix domain-containing protein [Streptomyces caniscabiei]